ncbi:MAG: 2,3-diaminopropionate biosynthesis protein SbnA [Actinomycetia bacterium]|nr:2,3-diaminopropionate biosynthesis protein SbnA [Actinomycetes bacterium]MCH9700122.1 2,3-diaminopropionate biosynthesis protein SbnA [Actinomycetes bacterium]MCH9762000.1 2,3-diaminopropionate biosynthesis protein SbnA [Actinomycetes bacterium]
MTVISVPHAFNQEDLYVDLRGVFQRSLYLKCEGMNFAGSVKLKPATEMVEAAERDGVLSPNSILVESSSGNLGVALSMVAASKGYRFVCVTDSRCNAATRRLMEAFGAEVHTVTTPSKDGGYLGARLDFIRRLRKSDRRYVWLDQYGNQNNWQSHYHGTAPSILQEFPALDVLFVGAGTTGTLMGCARYLRHWHPDVRVVAIDSAGTASFGHPAGRRMIPGLGMAMRPPMLDENYVDDLVLVEEPDTVRTCHRLAGRGFLFGGSTGTVVTGALRWLEAHDAGELTAVAISPDFGERYLDTIYNQRWLDEHFPDDMPGTGPRPHQRTSIAVPRCIKTPA